MRAALFESAGFEALQARSATTALEILAGGVSMPWLWIIGCREPTAPRWRKK